MARMAILDLVLEQAASVTELATALGKPKSSVAHHVDVLQAGRPAPGGQDPPRPSRDGGVLRPDRSHRLGELAGPEHPPIAAGRRLAEQLPPDDTCGGDFTLRHARIAAEQADVRRTAVGAGARIHACPREGDVVYGLIAGVYPTAHGVLPRQEEQEENEA